MSCPEYSIDDRQLLLGIARTAIEIGLESTAGLGLEALADPRSLGPALVQHRSTFVTLRKLDTLRGCRGSLEPRRPLIEDVAESARHAAFCDPRFPSLARHELDDVRVELSVLSPLSVVRASDEEDLLSQLNPAMGLMLEGLDGRRGTFLPKVWESLPDPRQFLIELKHKAGMPRDFWSSDVRVFSYHTESFAEAG